MRASFVRAWCQFFVTFVGCCSYRKFHLENFLVTAAVVVSLLRVACRHPGFEWARWDLFVFERALPAFASAAHEGGAKADAYRAQEGDGEPRRVFYGYPREHHGRRSYEFLPVGCASEGGRLESFLCFRPRPGQTEINNWDF